MKFKDNFMYKLYDLKKNNRHFTCETIDYDQFGEVYIYTFEVGVYVALEALIKYMSYAKSICVKFKLIFNNYNGKCLFYDVEEALEFLRYIDVTRINSITITEDCGKDIFMREFCFSKDKTVRESKYDGSLKDYQEILSENNKKTLTE